MDTIVDDLTRKIHELEADSQKSSDGGRSQSLPQTRMLTADPVSPGLRPA